MPDQITEKLDADKPPNKAAFAGCARLGEAVGIRGDVEGLPNQGQRGRRDGEGQGCQPIHEPAYRAGLVAGNAPRCEVGGGHGRGVGEE